MAQEGPWREAPRWMRDKPRHADRAYRGSFIGGREGSREGRGREGGRGGRRKDLPDSSEKRGGGGGGRSYLFKGPFVPDHRAWVGLALQALRQVFPRGGARRAWMITLRKHFTTHLFSSSCSCLLHCVRLSTAMSVTCFLGVKYLLLHQGAPKSSHLYIHLHTCLFVVPKVPHTLSLNPKLCYLIADMLSHCSPCI